MRRDAAEEAADRAALADARRGAATNIPHYLETPAGWYTIRRVTEDYQAAVDAALAHRELTGQPTALRWCGPGRVKVIARAAAC